MSQRDIASLTGRPLSSINRIVKAFRDEQRLENLSRGSRSKATTDDEDRMIVAAAVDDPTLTAKEIQAELNLQVSVKTIRNRLHEAGLRNRVPPRKPLLSAVNRQKRLQFAQEHASWSPADWENVLFSDESTFTTRWDQRQRIWRADNTSRKKLPDFLPHDVLDELAEVRAVAAGSREGDDAGKSLEMGGLCLKGTFDVFGFPDEIFDGGWGVADKATEDVILYASHQDPKHLLVGGLRVGASDQAQNIFDKTGGRLA
ncbi:hypothetical protein HPB47_026834 [Ixodes persulcatus]|uniref:Uncharacterized protein n=1 Tax=Ixodes persulcatus TaxID=34615 RepID=A0AC60PXI6_IXOPE|nr:hypothetical protein HPB47_026834 [Ixodes persulcatus]